MYGNIRLYAIEWDGTAFVQRASGFPEMVNTSYQFTDDGVIADAGWYGLAGAGYSRDYYQRWTWVGQVLTMTVEVFGPPTARIFYLYDGDDALMRGNVITAVLNYQEAISRTDMPSGVTGSSGEYSQVPLETIAHFKLLTAYAVAGDEANLAAIYQELQGLVPETSNAYVYVKMAQAFWEAYQAGQGAREACAAAIAVATDDDMAVNLLYAGYARFAGYDNTRYEKPEDLCRVP